MAADNFDAAIQEVGEYAAALVQPDMRLGLGTGRTAAAFLEALRPRLADGLRITAVCTSKATEDRARALGITVGSSTEVPLDLDIDGADEIDSHLDLIKGAGGAMVREKVVAERSRRFWVVADRSKVVRRLGETRPVPLEVLQFDWQGTMARVATACSCRPELRGDGDPYVTDNGNFILDLHFQPARLRARELVRSLAAIPGVLGHGLFLGTATAALISSGSGVTVLGDLDRRRDLT